MSQNCLASFVFLVDISCIIVPVSVFAIQCCVFVYFYPSGKEERPWLITGG